MEFLVSGPPGTQALGIMGTQAELEQLLSEYVCVGEGWSCFRLSV